ncbi:hypothetical protein ABZ357_03150 [Streptomyces sp. NPDC005917]|uniref:hypothetical protein n=1 Tax=unclassified Streptomyces TaxID=2593676 RepID=UPI0033F7BCA0
MGRGGAVGTGNVRMCGLHAVPDSGAPGAPGEAEKSLRGRSGRLGPVTREEPAAVSAEDEGAGPAAPRRPSDDGSGSSAPRTGRSEAVDSAADSGRRDA